MEDSVDTDVSWLSAVLSKRDKERSIVEVTSASFEPAAKAGDNYCSSTSRGRLQVVLGSGRVATKSIFVKKILSDIPPEVAEENAGAFIVEGFVYEKIFTAYESIIKKYCLPYNNLWPDCLFSDERTLILEDLSKSGYEMASRKNGLDLHQAKLAYKSLARLHALSLVGISKGKIYTRFFNFYNMAKNKFCEKFFTVSFKSLAEVIHEWGNEWTSFETKIRSLVNEIFSMIGKLYDEPHKLSVLNHGDCWVNNMMFRCDKEFSDVKFIDFQGCYYNSYGWDFIYLLYTSINAVNIDSFRRDLIEVYVDEFVENLRRTGMNVSLAPTVVDVEEELLRLRHFGMAVSLTILPVVTNPADLSIDLNELTNEDTDIFTQIYQHQQFSQSLQILLKHFEQQEFNTVVNN